jgi:hypothetical protein
VGASNKLIDLRKLLAARFPQPTAPPTTVLPTGIEFLDEIAGGGLLKSAITELISPKTSAGSASLIHGLLRSAQCEKYFVALIDGSDSFDPGSVDNSTLQQLLWVRCRKALDAIKAADFLLRDGNFPLVIIDLVLSSADELRQIPQTSWYRLQRLAEAVPIACLVINRQSLVGSAQLKIILENSWALADLENENVTSNLRFRVQRFGGANFTTGGRELIANRSREAGDSVLVITERPHLRSDVTGHRSQVR